MITFNRLIAAGILIAVFGGLPHRSFAQSEAAILEQCVVSYNSLSGTVNSALETKDRIALADSVCSVAEENAQRLAILIASSDSEIAKCARYFHMNFKYKCGFAQGGAGAMNKSLQRLEEIERDMEYFTEYQFPIRYAFNGKNYIINWNNFSPTKAEFYIGLGELYFDNHQTLKAKNALLLAIPLLNEDKWLQYVLYDQLIQVKRELGEYDDQLIGYCAAELSAYYNLTDEFLEIVRENKYSTYKKAIAGIDECLDRRAITQSGYQHLINAVDKLRYYIDPLKERDESTRMKNKFTLLRWYDTAVDSPYATKDLIKTAFTFTRYNAPDETTAMISWLKKYETLLPGCEEYRWIMDSYNAIGAEVDAALVQPKLNECEARQQEQAAQAEKERKENEEKSARMYRRSGRQPFFYLGGNVFPFFTKPKDYGLALNIGGRGMVIELSYLKVNGKPENYFDLSLRDISDVPEHRWDGYFAHINFKFPMEDWDNGQARSYAGFVLAYNERTFTPFTSNVRNEAFTQFTTEEFRPTSRQYLLMGNMGFMGVAGFGIDLFFGMGVAYNKFDGHSASWNNPELIVEDAMIENRLPDYFSFSMRMGMSMGIGWARP
jgi:hypothetical protein